MGWDSNIVIRGEYSELPLTTSLTYVDERLGLAAEHLEIAAGVAGRLHRLFAGRVDADELIGDAHLALVEAERDFDPARGVPFGAWATIACRRRVVDGLRSRYGRRFERLRVVSLDAPVADDTGETLADRLPAAADIEQQIVARDRLRRVIALPAKQKEALLRRRPGARKPSPELSDAEREALKGAALGESAEQTARRTFKATETIKTHRRRVIAKLRARNMTHAVYLAAASGLI